MEVTQEMLVAAMREAVKREIFPMSGPSDVYLRYWTGMKAAIQAALDVAPIRAAEWEREAGKRGATVQSNE